MFTEDDVRTAREYLQMFCEKPDVRITGALSPDWESRTDKRDLDIVIPCYNVEKYLKECVDSVALYKFRHEVGIILVDDGSTDSTGEIAEEYRKYPNVQVIHQSNKGLSGARNEGIRKSNSRYLFLLDADDFVIPEKLEAMLDFAMENEACTVRGIMFNVVEGNILRPETETGAFTEISHYNAAGYAGGTLLRSSLFQDICFPDTYLYEDTIMYALLSPLSRKSYEYDASVYAYRMNPDGITARSQFDKRAVHSFWILELMLETIERLGIPMEIPLFDKLLGLITQTYMRIRHLDQNVKTAVFIATCAVMRDLCQRLRTEDRFRRVLEEGLRSENLSVYEQGCSIVWEAMKVGK
ncbi:MAG: glycosyltransferase [Lachnospiraceae bacterium]|nr:glycosyltransferase [Lachnospiraceae bacterium]